MRSELFTHCQEAKRRMQTTLLNQPLFNPWLIPRSRSNPKKYFTWKRKGSHMAIIRFASGVKDNILTKGRPKRAP